VVIAARNDNEEVFAHDAHFETATWRASGREAHPWIYRNIRMCANDETWRRIFLSHGVAFGNRHSREKPTVPARDALQTARAS
jgi:hypothetical protein